MKHIPQEQLADMLKKAAQQVIVGARYKHYKNKYYVVEKLAILESTDEVAVLYRADYGANVPFVRPLKSWLEHVTVDGISVPRFRQA